MGEPATEHQGGLRAGVLIADKYRLVEQRGEGAMGAVWSATHQTLGHTVAVKFLHGNVAMSSEPRARFEREARLAARLGESSRHITRVTDHGITADGTPFLVMELLHGEGLEKRLKRERRLPLPVVARITAQLSRALHVAHGAGVIHRDLKPANVFLCEGEAGDGAFELKLLDFGVAKATLDNEENQQTRAGALIGTPNYMSPEQIAGSGVDHRSDLWAVAAIVYRMAVGRAPFGSGALSELAMRIVSTEPPQATSLAPDLPHEFDLWVQKGLAKDPDKRFQSARELSDSLAMVAGISASGSTGSYSSGAAERLALQLGDSVAGLQHTVDGTPAPHAPPPPPRRRAALPLVAAFALLLIGGVAVGLWAGRTHERSTDAPAASASTTASNGATTDTAPLPPAPAPNNGAPTASAPPPSPQGDAVSTKGDASGVAVASPSSKAPLKPHLGGAVVKGPAKSTSEPAAATTPPPPAATTADKANELWKKKDEM